MIKAYDKQLNKIVEVQMINFEGQYALVADEEYKPKVFRFRNKITKEERVAYKKIENEIILLRESGVIDKNDIKLIEGDIIDYRNEGDFLIKFVKNAFRAVTLDKQFGVIPLYSGWGYDKSGIERIGNKHTHPKLNPMEVDN